MRPKQRTLSIVTLQLAVLTMAAIAPQGQAQPTPDDAASASRAADQTQVLLDSIWWNQADVVGALRLRDEQRTQMDRRLRQFIADRHTAGPQLTERQRAFADALVQGDWDAARAAGPALRQAVADAIDAHSGLKIDVLSLLDEGQRETFVREYPNLLQRPWVVGMP